MARPRSKKRVMFIPEVTCFRPAWIHMRDLQELELSLAEMEAVRLKDVIDLTQKEAAELMHISQPTFHRVLLNARRKIAHALINGSILNISIEKT
ncbi:MAG: DUF134 domain-containing protein [Candidatus Nanoarchaeia archaeon]